METIQAIRSRRSVRKYQQRLVPHEVIEQIIADAAYAPSWKNTQIARYVLVEDRATIDKMAEEMVLDFKLNEKTLKNCLCDRPLGLRARRLVLDAEGGGL
jgi:nitroreductase